MKEHHQQRCTDEYKCDKVGCGAEAEVFGGKLPHDWTQINRHAHELHFCFKHGLDVMNAVFALGINDERPR